MLMWFVLYSKMDCIQKNCSEDSRELFNIKNDICF